MRTKGVTMQDVAKAAGVSQSTVSMILNQKSSSFPTTTIEKVLAHGFEFVQMGRALINEPDFVNRMKNEGEERCGCDHTNYCIARMYSIEMACHKHLEGQLPPCIAREIEKMHHATK